MKYSYLKEPLTPAERKRLRTALSAERRLTRGADSLSRFVIANRLFDATRAAPNDLDPKLRDWLLSYGRPTLIKAFLRQTTCDPRNHFSLTAMRAVDPAHILPRDYIAPHFQSWKNTSHARHALIAFAGNAQRFNMPVQVFHALFCRGFDLLFYLRDPSRQRFTQGLPGLGTSFDELCAYLRQRIPQSCAISVLGTSAGGYAAAALADRMKVTRVAAFSPPSRFGPRPALGSRPATPASRAALFFAIRNIRDRELATTWRGTPYTSPIRWLDTTSHGTLAFLVRKGETERLIAWLRAETQDHALPGQSPILPRISRGIRGLFTSIMP